MRVRSDSAYYLTSSIFNSRTKYYEVTGTIVYCPEAGDLFSYYGLEDDFHYEDLLQLLQNLHQRDERPQIDKIRVYTNIYGWIAQEPSHAW